MPKLGYMIVDSLAFVMVGVSLTAVVAGYERNLPDPAAQFVQITDVDEDWMDPVTTGSITPKAKGATAAQAESDAKSSNVATRAWVDPPHRWSSGGRADPAIDQAAGPRLPRL